MNQFKNIIDFLNFYEINVKSKENLNLFHQSLIHGSIKKDGINNYQSLEFLGDAVLQYAVSKKLYKSDLEPGIMTLIRSRAVRTETLNICCEKIGLKKLIKTNFKMREQILESKKVGADVFEAFIGALNLNSGINGVDIFLNKTLWNFVDLNDESDLKDPKTSFQEHVQSFSKKGVSYRTYALSENMFTSEAIHESKVYGKGCGKSKLEAEENAAKDALNKLRY